ncbi:MAG: response regulator transcription factor [Saprospiraceae bacterium]|nr:response regulator transcription factor [Saprospiraceae bacterium]
MTKGMSSPEIAEKLGLSHNTINNQKNHMIKKFGCNSSTELVAKLFRQGFLKDVGGKNCMMPLKLHTFAFEAVVFNGLVNLFARTIFVPS